MGFRRKSAYSKIVIINENKWFIMLYGPVQIWVFSRYVFFSKLWLSCIRYEIAMYHYLTAVNLYICDQRQVILEHRSCRVKSGGYARLLWYEKTFRFGGIKVDMPCIGLIWNLINIALESSCSDVRIVNNKIHAGVICKEANIRPNVRDNVIDKNKAKQWSQYWSLWHPRGQDLPPGARTRQNNTLLSTS